MLNKKTLYSGLFLICLIFIGQNINAQNQTSSPYSRFGLGEVMETTNVRNTAMGGIVQGVRSHGYLTPQNPATYTTIDSLTFLFDAGLYAQTGSLSSGGMSSNFSNASVKYLTLGFPITHWWKSSIGLLPFTSVGYDIYSLVEDQEKIGDVYYSFNGGGGINMFYLGNGFKLGDHFSLGANIYYMFGTIEHERMVHFPDSIYIKNTRVTDDFAVSDFNYLFGLQYYNKLWGYDFTAGASFGNKTSISGDKTRLVETLFGGFDGGTEIGVDTIQDIEIADGKVDLPAQFGMGFSFSKPNKWTMGADFGMTLWKDYEAFGSSDSLENSYYIALGAEWMPSNTSVSSYFQRIKYRFGFRYEKDYLNLHKTNLNEYSLSFGMGLPLPRSRTTVNLAVQVGTRGTTEDDLIRENFVKFSLGMSISELWFFKRRYK